MEREGHYFVGPDNGIFSLIFEDLTPDEVYEIDQKSQGLGSIAETLSWAIKYISEQRPIQDIGPVCKEINFKMGIKPVVTGSQIRATIIHVDHYQNVVINLQRNQFEQIRNGRAFQLY